MRYSKKKVLAILIGILILGFIGAAADYLYKGMDYQKNLLPQPEAAKGIGDSVHQEEQKGYDFDAGKNVIYILFLGIDRTDERDSWLGVYRTDTLALAKIDLKSKKVKVLNIPRDTYTYLPIEEKLDKINHAYAYGSLKGNGIQASIEAVNHFMSRNIVNFYFLMDMEPIPDIVDQVGGVKLDVEVEMKDHGANLEKGYQVLNGKQAFDYIHWRYSAGGDIDRIKRQQKFISALNKQQRDSGKVLETLQIILKHKDSVKTDFTMQQMIGFAKFMSDLPEGSVTYYTISGQSEMINNISYWIPDKSNTEELLNEFLE